jgi:hypothetical protein
MAFFSDFSNRELNIWATLGLDVGVTVYYFSQLLDMPDGLNGNIAELGGLVVKIIVFSIVFSIIVFGAINARGEEKRDERDYRFEAKANKIAYLTLSVCVIFLLGQITINEVGVTFWSSLSAHLPLSPIVISHLLLLALLLASTAKALSQMILYRRDMV